MRARLVVCAAVLAASAAARAEPLPAFEPLAFLAGHCWRGTFPDGVSIDEHCYEWVFDGQHLRDRHTVQGTGAPYHGETIYSWDEPSSRVIYRYWNSLGGHSDGHLEFSDGNVDAPGERYTGPGGAQFEMRSRLRRTGERSYEARTETLRDGTWVEEWRIVFQRVE